MKSVTQCLQTSDIEALLAGTVQASQCELWEEHFSSCESCRTAMASHVGDDEWWREAEQSLRGETIPEVCDSVKSEADERESIEELLKLLGPTDDPQMMGRIGSYEVLGVLGRGGMGVVFKAFDAALNRFVAIKMLLPHLAASGAARKRFAREGQAVAAVVDDHVMAIHCVDEWQGVPYLVMTYSRGVSLQKRLSDNGPSEVREILRIGMQAAKGLAAAHAQGIVHRDIKPANIFLDQNVERVQLMDFGLARAVDDASLTRSGTLAGTPEYMSPEQARAETVDHRSDLFSLGSVMFAMCTGHAPFRAESSYSVLRLITDKEPHSIRELNPDIPEWLCWIIGKLMAKQAIDRFESAKVVAELLEECLAHIQQPTSVPLPKSLVPQTVNHRSDFSAAGKGVLTMLGTLGMTLLGMVVWQATEAPDISGQWISDEWGTVVLEANGSGKYEGTFTRSKEVQVDRMHETQIEKHGVFAPRDSIVVDVFIENGQFIRQGYVLMVLRDDDLDAELRAAEKAVREAKTRLNNLTTWFRNDDKQLLSTLPRDFETEYATARAQLAEANEKTTLLQQEIEALKIRSNVDGFVANMQATQNLLNRPVQRGDRLFEIMTKVGPRQDERSPAGPGKDYQNETPGFGVAMSDSDSDSKMDVVVTNQNGPAPLAVDFSEESGTLHLNWSRVERRFNGTWGKGVNRSGKISLRLVDNDIRGAWTTCKDAQKESKSDSPRLGDLLWRRAPTSATPLVTMELMPGTEVIKLKGSSADVNSAVNMIRGIADGAQDKQTNPSGNAHNIESPGSIDRKNARSVVEAFVEAALAGRIDEAVSLIDQSELGRDDRPAHRNAMAVFFRQFNVQQLAMKSVYVNDPVKPTIALATSEAVKLTRNQPDGQRDFFLVVLTMNEAGWVVTGNELQSEESADLELKKFLKANPNAIGVPPQATSELEKSTFLLAETKSADHSSSADPNGEQNSPNIPIGDSEGSTTVNPDVPAAGKPVDKDKLLNELRKRDREFSRRSVEMERTWNTLTSPGGEAAQNRHNSIRFGQGDPGIPEGLPEDYQQPHRIRYIWTGQNFESTLEVLADLETAIHPEHGELAARTIESDCFNYYRYWNLDREIFSHSSDIAKLGGGKKAWEYLLPSGFGFTQSILSVSNAVEVDDGYVLKGLISLPSATIGNRKNCFEIHLDKELILRKAVIQYHVYDFVIVTSGRSEFTGRPPLAKLAAVSIHHIGQDEKRSGDVGNYRYEVISLSEKLNKAEYDLRVNFAIPKGTKLSAGLNLVDVNLQGLPGVIQVERDAPAPRPEMTPCEPVQATGNLNPKRLQIREAEIVEEIKDVSEQSEQKNVVEFEGKRLRIDRAQKAILTEDDIVAVESVTDLNNPKASQILITLTQVAGERFLVETNRLSSKPTPGYLVIEFDGAVLSAPRVNDKISNKVAISFAERDQLDMERLVAAVRESMPPSLSPNIIDESKAPAIDY